LVYPERLEHHIALSIVMVGDVRQFRAHVKTRDTKEMLQFQFGCTTDFRCCGKLILNYIEEQPVPYSIREGDIYG